MRRRQSTGAEEAKRSTSVSLEFTSLDFVRTDHVVLDRITSKRHPNAIRTSGNTPSPYFSDEYLSDLPTLKH